MNIKKLDFKKKILILGIKFFVFFIVIIMYGVLYYTTHNLIEIMIQDSKKTFFEFININKDINKNIINLRNNKNISGKEFLNQEDLILNLLKKEEKNFNIINEIIKKDLLSYGYVCNKFKKEIFDKKINIKNISAKEIEGSFFIKKKIKIKLDKIKHIIGEREMKNKDFYNTKCNSKSWLKILVRKYFM